MYQAAWVIVLLPLLGGLLSFVAETPRRAAHLCMAALAGSLIVALIVLGYRFAHLTTSATPDVAAVSFFSVLPQATETSIFSSTFSTDLGVWVDNLSTSFMALTCFLILVIQGMATAMLRGDSGYRRFFWVSSVLASAMLAMIAAPSLFQVWMTLGVMSVATLILALHRWHREESGPPAWRAFLTLLGADTILLLGLIVIVYKLGTTMGLEDAPPGFSSPPMYDFRILGPAWQQAAANTVQFTGYRSLVILCLLLVLPALIRSAQIPFTGWLTGLREAPLPVLGVLTASLLAGIILVARVYDLLLLTRHALSGLALVGAVGAVVLAAACLASRDIYRLAMLSTAAQLALAMTALGAGGYSPGLLIGFVSAPVSLLLLTAAGSAARAYRTRDLRLMGGAWGRMRRTSLALGLWAVLAGGLDLVGYDVLSAVFQNHFPTGGHMAGPVQVAVAALTIAALLLTPLYAGRVVLMVCAGKPAARRGGVVERIIEAEPRLRQVQTWAGVAAVVSVLTGLPGVTTLGSGKSRVPGLTFSHWVFYGPARQSLPVQPQALLIAAATLVAGLALARFGGRVQWAAMSTRLHLPRLSAQPAIAWAVGQLARAGDALAGEVAAVDRSLIGPLYDAAGQGVETAAWSLGRAPGRRFRLSLAAALVAVLLLIGFSVLAAGGHFPVHTT